MRPLHSREVKPTGVYVLVLKTPASKIISGINFRDAVSPPVTGTVAMQIRARAQVHIYPYVLGIKARWTDKGQEVYIDDKPEPFAETDAPEKKKQKTKAKKKGKKKAKK